MAILSLLVWVFSLVMLRLPVSKSEIRDLSGEPDFRSVTIRWRNALPLYNGPLTFRVQTCEVQEWGNSRCKSQSLEPFVKDVASSQWKWYSATVKDLRMATNYMIEVQPVLLAPTGKRRAMGQVITISTKSYSAKASQCLADASRIEVETGPHFSGKISVEDTKNPACSLKGDPNSTQNVYALTIDHQLCGSQSNGSAVITYVLVQESLAIITHTTRRFLVVCNFQPDTFVVQTGVQLPPRRDLSKIPQRATGAWDVVEKIAESHSTRNDIANEVQSLKLMPHAMHEEDGNILNSGNYPQFVLMMVLLCSVLIGLCVGVGSFAVRRRWRFRGSKLCARRSEKHLNSSNVIPGCQENSNMEAEDLQREELATSVASNPSSAVLCGSREQLAGK